MSEIDLFGVTIEEAADPRAKRPAVDRAHAAPPGSGPRGECCGGCASMIRRGFYPTHFFKCHGVNWTHGAATDIRVSDAACERFSPKKSNQAGAMP